MCGMHEICIYIMCNLCVYNDGVFCVYNESGMSGICSVRGIYVVCGIYGECIYTGGMWAIFCIYVCVVICIMYMACTWYV